LLASPLAGCVAHLSTNVSTVIFLVPIMLDDDRGRMRGGGGYTDSRWFADPDSHPAVRPKPAPRPAPGNAAAAAPPAATP